MALTRIGRALEATASRGERALVVYLAAGDPSVDETVELVLALERAGVDIVELGMPFSDPVADGPTIQAAYQRALAAGTTPDQVFSVVSRVRRRSELPIVIMTYCSLVHRRGWKFFASQAATAGVDGILVTDLPVSCADPWLVECRALDIDPIFLVAPTSRQDTVERVGRAASGFVYGVSRAGVTGAQERLPEGLPELVGRVRAVTDVPVCVGFGISSPEHVAAVTEHADGAVVGSAVIERISRHVDREQRIMEAYGFCSLLKSATRRPGANAS